MEAQLTEKKEATRKRIVDAALVLFSKEGYYNASIRTIAKEADIALGLLYNYFGSKELLLKAIFRQGIDVIRQDFEKETGKNAGIDVAARAALTVLLQHGAYWRLLHSVRMQQSLADVLAAEITEINDFFISHFRGLLKAGKAKNPRTEARILFAAIDGIFAESITTPGFDLEKTIKVLAAKF